VSTLYCNIILQVREDAKDVKVGTIIALMVAEGEDWKSVEVPKSSDASSSIPPPPPPPLTSSEPTLKPGSGGNGNKKLLEHKMGS
jgi:hypothetical protein